jgi:uncharacterized protein (DUF1330 family)
MRQAVDVPKAYVLVDMRVTDPDRYARYREMSGPAVAAYGGRFLARGGATEVLEGDRVPNRVVVIEFPDMAAARTWYDSPEYREARAAREGVANGYFVLVEGAD